MKTEPFLLFFLQPDRNTVFRISFYGTIDDGAKFPLLHIPVQTDQAAFFKDKIGYIYLHQFCHLREKFFYGFRVAIQNISSPLICPCKCHDLRSRTEISGLVAVLFCNINDLCHMIPPLLKYPFYGIPIQSTCGSQSKNYFSYSAHSRSKASNVSS